MSKACIVGYPVEHSLSPVIHNAAYEHLNLNWKYDRQEVRKETFVETMKGLIDSGYSGFNVTMPCKEVAHSFCDFTYGAAKRLHSVNTIVLKDGQTHGYSTDGRGFTNFLKSEKIDIKNKKVIVLGSGGAARAVCDSLYEEGAHIILCARNVLNSMEICETIVEVEREISYDSSSIDFVNFDDRNEAVQNAKIIINATPIGMGDSADEVPFDPSVLNTNQIVVDTIYHPLDTRLIQEAKKSEIPTFNGVGMLLYQAAISFELMTGETAPIDIMRKALLEEIDN